MCNLSFDSQCRNVHRPRGDYGVSGRHGRPLLGAPAVETPALDPSQHLSGVVRRGRFIIKCRPDRCNKRAK